MKERKEVKVKKTISKRKKITWASVILVVGLAGFVAIQAFAASPLPKSYESDANYYYHKGGKFSWYGSSSKTEYGGSWKTTPQSPNTLYSTNRDDNQFVGHHENGGLGFKAYSSKWESGNAANPIPAGNVGKHNYFKRVTVDYRRAKTTPLHRSMTVSGEDYKNGNDYWVKPTTEVDVKAHGYQTYEGGVQQLDDFIRYTYIKVTAPGEMGRSRMSYDGSLYLNSGSQSDDIGFTKGSVSRTDGNRNLYTTVGVTTKGKNADYTLEVHHTSMNGKARDYKKESQKLRTDGDAPVYNSGTITGHSYKSGSNYWVKPNATVKVTVKQTDSRSGNKYQFLRLNEGSTEAVVRSRHDFDGAVSHNLIQNSDAGAEITAAKRTSSSSVGTVEWSVKTKTNEKNYTVQAYLRDNVNNSRDYTTIGNVIVDGTAPTVAFSTNGSSTYKDSHSTKVTASDSGSGVSTTQYAWSTSSTATPSSWSNLTNGGTLSTPSSTGTHYLWVKTTDNVGNTTTTKSSGFNVDNTNPSVSFSPNGNTTYADRHAVKVTASDSHSGIGTTQYAWSTSGTATPSSWSNFTNGGTLNTPTATGSHYLWVKITDKAGNTITNTSNYFRVDKTLPTVSASPTSGAWQTTAHTVTPTYGDAHSGISTQQYAWSTSTTTPTSWTNYTSGALKQPGAGAYYLHLKVTDKAGNTTTSRVGPYRYEATSPIGTISQTPTAWTTGNVTVNLKSISDSGGSGYYRTKLPNGTFTTSTSASETVTANGTYSFVIYDNAGNSKTESLKVTNIDKTAPSLSFSNNGGGYAKTHSTKITGSDSGSGVKSVVYQWTKSATFPGGTFTTITNGGTVSTPSSEGDHYLHARVTDNAGSTRNLSSSVFRVDTSAPTHVSSLIEGQRYTSGSTYWVRPNDNLDVTFRQRDQLSGNQRGYIRLVGNDQDVRYYNQFTSSATSKVVVGSAYVETSSLAIPSVNRTEHNTSTGYGAVKWTVQPKVHAHSYQVQYYYSDNAGNVVGYSTVGTVKTDGVAPIISLSPNSGSYAKAHSPKVTATDSDSGLAKLEYQWTTSSTFPSGTFQTISTGATISAPNTLGSNYLHVRATDNVGNVKTHTSGAYQIDNVAPTISASPTSGAWDNIAHQVTPKYADAHSGISTQQYAWSTSTSTPSSWTNYTSGTLTQPGVGTYYLHLKVIDKAGHTTTSRVGPYHYEKTLPSFTANPSSGDWKTTAHVVTPNYSDTHSGVKTQQYAWSTSTSTPSSWINYTSGTLTQPGVGTYYLHYKVIDNAGNSVTSRVGPYQYETTKPTGNLTQTPTEWTKGGVTLNLTSIADSGGSTFYRTKLPNGTYSTSTSASQTVTANGTYSFVIYDKAGNSTTKSINVTNIDKTAPTGTTSHTPTSWTNENVALTVNGSDTGSGVESITMKDSSDLAGRNFIVNSELKSKSVSLTWNDSLNGKLAPNGGWSSGINTGTANPTVGYHAHLNESTFGYPVLAYTNKNGQFGHKNRWLGFSQSFSPTDVLSKQLKVGQKLIVSFDLRSDKVGGEIYGGMYRYHKDTAVRSFPKQGVVQSTKANTWESVSFEQTVDADWDFTKTIAVYLYGNREDGEATKWVKNIKLELGDSPTGFSVNPDDIITASSKSVFDIAENGKYDFLITDNAGNTVTKSHSVTNIDKVNPTGKFTYSTTSPTNQNVTIKLTGNDLESGVKTIQLPDGTVLSGETGSYTVSANGSYVFTVTDVAGNQVKLTAKVGNVDKVPPKLTLTPSTTDWTNDSVTLKATASDAGGIKNIILPDGKSVASSTASYKVTENGTYTFQAFDSVGNKTTKSITVTNIDQVLPKAKITEMNKTNSQVNLKLEYSD